MTSLNSLIRIAILATAAIVLLILGSYFGWKLWTAPNGVLSDLTGRGFKLPSEHLIPGVPYWGQYLGTTLTNQESVAVRTLVDYWNIPGVENEELKALFEPSLLDNPGHLGALGTRLTAQFFWAKDFNADGHASSSPELIKLLIANNIPVYIRQRLGSEYMPELMSTRIYIGYSDAEQHFIVHDNNFGNNYQIPYDEYEKISSSQFVLVVKPDDYPISNQPNAENAGHHTYPARLGIMDDLGLRDLQVKIMEMNWYKADALLNKNNRVAEAVEALEEIINHEAFERLHPASQMTLSYNLTGFYMSEAPDLERAIEILENVTLPLIEEHDFSKPYGGWDRKMDPSVYDHPFFHAGPWTRLGYLYVRTGNSEAARAAFDKALSYQPDFDEALNGLALIGN